MSFKIIVCYSVDIEVVGHAIYKERKNNIITILIFCDNGVGLLVWLAAINAWTFVDSDSVCPALHETQQVIPEFWNMIPPCYTLSFPYSRTPESLVVSHVVPGKRSHYQLMSTIVGSL